MNFKKLTAVTLASVFALGASFSAQPKAAAATEKSEVVVAIDAIKKEMKTNRELKEKIDEYKLNKFLSAAVMYISKEYPINVKKIKNIIDIFKIDEKILDKYPKWPYDNEMHLKIKKEADTLPLTSTSNILE